MLDCETCITRLTVRVCNGSLRPRRQWTRLSQSVATRRTGVDMSETKHHTGNGSKLPESLELQKLLNSIVERIHEADRFDDILPGIEPDMLRILNGERMTVYQRTRNERAIVSKFKSGTELKRISVPLSNTSIAGHVALTQESLRVDDVHDGSALEGIHPDLRFDSSFDERGGFTTRSMVAVPIMHKDVLLGVLQVLNRVGDEAFTHADLRNATRMANIIGQKFRYDFQSTNDPYEYLVIQNRVSAEQIHELEARAKSEKSNVPRLLVEEAKLSPEEIGASLERYYQVPFLGFDPEIEIPRDLFQGIKPAFLRHNMWVPVAGDATEATILIDNPGDHRRIGDIHRYVKAQQYVINVGLPDDIARYLGEEIGSPSDEIGLDAIVERMHEQEEMVVVAPNDAPDETVDENEPTVKNLVNRLILEAYRQGASDIHIEPHRGHRCGKGAFSRGRGLSHCHPNSFEPGPLGGGPYQGHLRPRHLRAPQAPGWQVRGALPESTHRAARGHSPDRARGERGASHPRLERAPAAGCDEPR